MIAKPTPRFVTRLIQKREAAKALRHASARVRRRDGGKCRCCGRPGTEVHHVVFRSMGGSDDPSNLVLLCARDHSAIHQHALKIYGTDANKRLTFEWHPDAQKAGLR